MEANEKIKGLSKQLQDVRTLKQSRAKSLSGALRLAMDGGIENLTEVTDLIRRLERDVAEADRQILNLQKQIEEAEKEREWKPTQEGWGYSFAGRLHENSKHHMDAAAGTLFQTQDAAQVASDYSRWFRLLLNLAAQVNPSGKPAVREYQAWWSRERGWVAFGSGEFDAIFENGDAAQKACDILNRQKGVLAGVSCPLLPKN